jgi:hypothetical protein
VSGSTNKRVVAQRFDREPVYGFVHPQTFQTAAGVEMLTREGSIVNLPYHEVKVLCFVQDFDETIPPLEGRVFTSRPKIAGLWVKMEFRDGSTMEGLLTTNLLQLETHGFTVTPPNANVAPQRVFVPRMAVRAVQMVAVVGGEMSAKRKKGADERQISIFD